MTIDQLVAAETAAQDEKIAARAEMGPQRLLHLARPETWTRRYVTAVGSEFEAHARLHEAKVYEPSPGCSPEWHAEEAAVTREYAEEWRARVRADRPDLAPETPLTLAEITALLPSGVSLVEPGDREHDADGQIHPTCLLVLGPCGGTQIPALTSTRDRVERAVRAVVPSSGRAIESDDEGVEEPEPAPAPEPPLTLAFDEETETVALFGADGGEISRIHDDTSFDGSIPAGEVLRLARQMSERIVAVFCDWDRPGWTCLTERLDPGAALFVGDVYAEVPEPQAAEPEDPDDDNEEGGEPDDDNEEGGEPDDDAPWPK